MIDINFSAIVIGVAAGLPMAVLFFWGLNWGMRQALASNNPAGVLMLSFMLRMLALLGVGLALTRLSGTLWALAGYMLAFLGVRIVAVVRAKISPEPHLGKQEGV